MQKFQLSQHARDMLKERNIQEEWLWRTIDNPDWENTREDNNIHYFRSILNMEDEFFMWL